MANANLCPLCGENNYCAIATDKQANACWCQQQIFDDDIIKQAQQAQQSQQCICQPCAKKAQRLAVHAK